MPETIHFQSLDEFWPYYVSQHMRKSTRRLHFVGTILGLLCLATAALRLNWRFLILSLVFSYSLAWISHFFIEKNPPATFRYPILSFRADLRMCRLILAGRMETEIAHRREQIAPYLTSVSRAP